MLSGPGLPRVLLVDDSELLRRTLTRVLRRGHEITTAADGLEALELVRAGHAFDVIVCDVSMPRMTGVEFYSTLLREYPASAARLMFATGGATTLRSMGFMLQTGIRVLLKPFSPSVLRAAIEEVWRDASASDDTRRLRVRRPSSPASQRPPD
jgi:CheY-like chemotaxis protein